MGICLSCLGLNRHRHEGDPPCPQPYILVPDYAARDIYKTYLPANLASPFTQDSETRGLLYDDPYRTRYGTDGTHVNGGGAQRSPYQQDPESTRRERETLEGIFHDINVIDVFTAQQPHLQVSGPYGPSRTPRIPSIAQAKKDCIAPLQARPQYSTTNEDEPTRADLSLRTIKKGRAGPIFSHRDQGITGLRAVQDAIG
ncbi:MAG: hypothetical protein LQ340_000185 [Diploschistes diacapsis]|nr:MAG: hypothetical protein LQ340_000185 [Diploschistes diacapsis]